MKKLRTIIVFILAWAVVPVFAAPPKSTGKQPHSDATFCNPMNIDYGFVGSKNARRAAADPVIVLFKDKYYLFTTNDRGGYRVSDDLLHWRNISFCDDFVRQALINGDPLAPAVAADSHYVYYLNFNGPQTAKGEKINIYRSADPLSGRWEVCGKVRSVADPCLFIDNGRYYVTHGLGGTSSTRIFELDPSTMTEIPGSERVLRPVFQAMTEDIPGYFIGQNILNKQLDAAFLLKGGREKMPCPEGSWMTKHNGLYYLEYAAPGTASQWYCDALMVGNSPTGPFVPVPYNPVSLRAGGFIGGAGHSCTFQDRYGNWWKVTTMWVGVQEGFERRIGLFPVKIDKEGRMRTLTELGDYPMLLPQRRFDPDSERLAGWYLKSKGKTVSVSSTDDGREAANASDEDVHTYWAAQSGNRGEWLSVDLGKRTRIDALQVNFYEHKADRTLPDTDDYHAYTVSTSTNGKSWKTLIDKSANKSAVPHDYAALETPVYARYVKVTNIHTPKGGHFAVSDLRIFGAKDGETPAAVGTVNVVRNATDARFAEISWNAVPGAQGYLIRFGNAPGFLNLCIQVKDAGITSLTTHLLTKGVDYWFRIDSYNENGITEGTTTACTPC